MTTDPQVGTAPPAPRGRPTGSRFERWRSSWRVSLRMAWRDVRSHKGRSALVFIMVAIPVGLLVGITCFAAMTQYDTTKALPRTLGSGVAVVTSPQETQIAQDETANYFSSKEAKATPIPGYDADADGIANAPAIGRLFGGTAVPEGSAGTRVVLGDFKRSMNVMVLDGSADLGTKAELRSGRWADKADEVVVTPLGVDRGLPESGTITAQDADGSDHTLTVVGVANAYSSGGGYSYMPELVTGTPWQGLTVDSWSWVITGTDKVAWSTVRDANQYGLQVLSRDAILNPPPTSALDPDVVQPQLSADSELAVLTAIGAVMLFVITVLLVAPAFAVSAARQRRTLALAASNGAETRQLRRSVLAQALVLGVLSTLVTAAVTVLGLWAFFSIWASTHPWTSFFGFTVPVLPMVLILACAILSTVVAALLPASRLGRLDIVGVMRGQTVSPPLNRWLPIAGLVLAAIGAAGIIWSVKTGQSEIPVVASGLLLVLGPIMVVPAILVLAGKLASRLPVTPRMATRDAARHRSRATPTVAAIMGGAAALTIFAIALSSDSEQQRREYTAQIPAGLGQFSVYSPNGGATDQDAAKVQAESLFQRAGATGMTFAPLTRIADPGMYSGTGPAEDAKFVAALPSGCTVDEAMGGEMNDMGEGPNAQPAPPRCAVLGSEAYTNTGAILALPMADLRTVMGLDDAQLDVLAKGGMVAMVPQLGSSAEVVTGTSTFDAQQGSYGSREVTSRATLPVNQIEQSKDNIGRLGPQAGAIVSTETAEKLGWPTYSDSVLVWGPDGISEDVEQTVSELADGDSYLYVERGFQREDAMIMGILFGAFAALLIIVTLISTSLALAEQQSDMGTFAAVGATRGTRRKLAAAQSAVVAVIGGLLGVVVGFFPGVALTYPLTSQSWDPVTGIQNATSDNILVIPWLPLVAVVVGVPLIAAGLSALAVRKAPQVTRRAE